MSTKRIEFNNLMKLDGTNFPKWKMQVTVVMKSYSLWDIVTGAETRPISDVTDQAKWDKSDNDAQAVLLLSISSGQMDHVHHCTTSKQIFDKLSEIHSDTSELNKQQTLTRFYSYKTGPNQSPIQAYTEIQDLARSLNEMGVKTEEMAVVTKIVSSLPDDKYQAFKAAWDSVDEKSQTMSRLLARLKKMELTVKSATEVESDISKAFHSHGTPDKKGSKEADDRREKIKVIKAKSTCHNCGQKGHWKRECRNRKRDGQGSEKEKTATATISKAFMGRRDNEQNAYDWISDSGASHHFCGRRECFIQYEEFRRPAAVNVASNETVMTLGEGVVEVEALIGKKWEVRRIEHVQFIPGAVNLFSEVVMANKGYLIERLGGETRYFEHNNKKIPGPKALFKGNVYVMCFRPVKRQANAVANAVVSARRWHQR